MSQWLSQVIEAGAAQNDWLAPVRQQALAQLQGRQWPTRKTEEWQFTSLAPLTSRELALNTQAGAAAAPVVEGLSSIDLIFADGVLITDLATIEVPQGVTIVSFAGADNNQQEKIHSVFGKVKPDNHLFGLVNDVLSKQGVFIEVADNVTVEKAIRIINLTASDIDAHTRIVVSLGEGAKASIIEHGQGDSASMNTAFAEYWLSAQAELEHYRFALFTGTAMQLGGSHFKLHERAQLNSTVVGYGSALSRLDIDVEHAGEHAFAKLNAVYLLGEGELFDLHTTIEHAVPNGTTEENVRVIVGDNARAVFNGRIHIHRDAQKTLAEMNNRNLLLSRRGVVNTKPELEIYADDVRCAHGATIAEIDDEALYYLLSRGVSRSNALVMLNFGFINELIGQIPNQAIADWLAPMLSERFAHMEVK